ncbi:hypothetical protein [Gemmatimonas sp.]
MNVVRDAERVSVRVSAPYAVTYAHSVALSALGYRLHPTPRRRAN